MKPAFTTSGSFLYENNKLERGKIDNPVIPF